VKLAIMQPYFFPYIGYWQLINAADAFVIYDDVNYIKQGWINRNRILVGGQPHYITVGLSGASSFKKINEIALRLDSQQLLKTIHQSYCKAPYFSEVYPMVERILNHNEMNLAGFVSNSIKEVMRYLNIETKCIVSSEAQIGKDLKGKERVISICKHYGATHYYNAIGGTALYDKEEFKENGIELKFLKTGATAYRQFDNDFVPSLSIIDLMMFNSIDETKKMLNEYELI
jgi:hypothetical protein